MGVCTHIWRSSISSLRTRLGKVSASWLVIVSLILVVLGGFLLQYFGLNANTLVILAILAGVIYAFTNANDSRLVGKRYKLIDEETLVEDQASELVEPMEFVAWGGLIGAIVTWGFLLPIYYFFSNRLGYDPSVINDLETAVSVGYLNIPFVILVGLMAVISTLVYLQILKQEQSIRYLAGPVVMITLLATITGGMVFKEEISDVEKWLFIPLFLFSCLTLVSYRKVKEKQENFLEELRGKQQKEPTPHKIPTVLLAFVFIILEVSIYLLVRYSLTTVPGDKRFFVALGFRAWYFSVFAGFGLLYILFKLKKWPAQSKTTFALVFVTTFTFMCSFFFRTTTNAYNLVIAPIAFLVGQVLAFPFIGAWYYTDGSRPNFFRRIKEVFGKVKDEEKINYRFISFYGITSVLCLLWLLVGSNL